MTNNLNIRFFDNYKSLSIINRNVISRNYKRCNNFFVTNQYNVKKTSKIRLAWTKLLILETLRKYTPVFALFRVATKTYRVPDDSLIIEKDQKILIPVHSLSYHPRHFTDPEVFDPERFIPDETAKRPKGTYLPFGDGPRYCIGISTVRYQNVIKL